MCLHTCSVYKGSIDITCIFTQRMLTVNWSERDSECNYMNEKKLSTTECDPTESNERGLLSFVCTSIEIERAFQTPLIILSNPFGFVVFVQFHFKQTVFNTERPFVTFSSFLICSITYAACLNSCICKT